MSTMNAQFFLNAFSDENASNSPSLNNVRWCRNIACMAISNPRSEELVVPAGQTVTLFNTARSLAQDNTTQYSLAATPFEAGNYTLSWTGGTAPAFRTARNIGTDDTSTIDITMNGPLMVISRGTNANFSSVVPGDYITLGSAFNASNVGTFKVLSATATSVSVQNETGVAQSGVALGSSFATNLFAYSASGVQVGDSLVISDGFSPLTQQTFVITGATPTALMFSATEVLPSESDIQTQIAVYAAAKRLVYMEADQTLSLAINTTQNIKIQPLISGTDVQPGIYFSSTLCYSIVITNAGITDANLFMISAE